MSIRKLSLVFACIGLAACSFGCDDEVGNLLSCTPGQTMCDGNSLKGCIGVTWSSIDCPQGCEETANGAQCKVPDGAECVVDKCKDSTTLNKCSNDFKVTVQPCGADQECVFNACVAKEGGDTCEAGAVKCSADNSGVIKCGADGKWGATEACPAGQSCDTATNACAENAKVCEAGEKKCEGNVAMVCNNNNWDQEDCGDTKECKGGVCEEKTGECDKSADSCAAEGKDFDEANCACIEKTPTCDKSAEICAADDGKAFDSELCECVAPKENCEDVPNSTLTDGVCVCNDGYEKNADGQCVEKTAACDKSAESCAAEDKDFDEAKCECVDKAAACDKSVEICAADDGKAFDSELCECVAPKENCEDVPNSTLKDGVCVCNEGFEKDDKGQCVEKTAACDKSAEICAKDGKDFDEAKCECVEKTAECKKTDAECSKDNKNMKLDAEKCECVCGLTKCEDGKELDAAKCECVAKIECKYNADEKKNEKMCKSSGNAWQRGTYVVCTEKGTWGNEIRECAGNTKYCDDYSSKTEVCTAGCHQGDPDRCADETTREVCERQGADHVYVEHKCGAGETCNNGKCECKPGEKKCSEHGGRIITCGNNKQWDEGKSCGNGKYCDAESKECVDNCKSGSLKCSDSGVLSRCGDNSRWSTISDCGGKDKCSDSTGCVCKSGKDAESKCDGDTILTCTTQGQHNQYTYWAKGATCAAGMCKVKDGAAYCSCTAGTSRCDGNIAIACNKDGKEEAGKDCGNRSYCSEQYGGVCAANICQANGDFCLGNMVVTCNHGQYELKNDCGDKKMCSTRNGVACQEIGKCDNHNTICVGTDVMSCQQGQWKVVKKCSANKPAQICVETTDKYTGRISADCASEECKDLAVGCDKDKKNVQVCVSNKWQNVADCSAAGMKCDAGVCKK